MTLTRLLKSNTKAARRKAGDSHVSNYGLVSRAWRLPAAVARQSFNGLSCVIVGKRDPAERKGE